MPAQPAFQAWCGSGISVRCNNDLQPLPDMAQNLMGHVVIGFTSLFVFASEPLQAFCRRIQSCQPVRFRTQIQKIFRFSDSNKHLSR